jgi:hypothetical protein
VTLRRTKRCMWLLSGRVWSMYCACGRLIRRCIWRGLSWTTQPLSPYESKCLLLGLEVLSDRRKITAALFVRDILCWWIESAYLADLLRFESNPRRRNARLMNFYHRKNYGQNEPESKAILIFNKYCDLFCFRDDESRYVFRNGFSHALSGERSYLL